MKVNLWWPYLKGGAQGHGATVNFAGWLCAHTENRSDYNTFAHFFYLERIKAEYSQIFKKDKYQLQKKKNLPHKNLPEFTVEYSGFLNGVFTVINLMFLPLYDKVHSQNFITLKVRIIPCVCYSIWWCIPLPRPSPCLAQSILK